MRGTCAPGPRANVFRERNRNHRLRAPRPFMAESHGTRHDALVFSMREVMGPSAEEICKEIGISTTKLHVIPFRAKLSLRSCMSKNRFEARRDLA